jgi:hypothetical protein
MKELKTQGKLRGLQPRHGISGTGFFIASKNNFKIVV